MSPCRRFQRVLRALLYAVLIASCGGGGGGVGSNEQAPPPPSDVSLALAAEVGEINEWHENTRIELTIALSEAQEDAVIVHLNSTGSATLQGDFDLSETRVRIPQGQTSARVLVSPIRDFEGEGDEVITIELGTIEGNGQLGNATSVSVDLIDQGALFTDAKEDLYAKLYVFFGDPIIGPDEIDFLASVYNVGAAATSATDLYFLAGHDKSLSGRTRIIPTERVGMGPIMPGTGSRYRFSLKTKDFPEAGTYYAAFIVDSPPEEAPNSRSPQDYGGVVIDSDHNVRVRCPDLPRNQSPGMQDPLRAAQWNLENTAQSAYAEQGGVAEEDLRMREALVNGPTGKGVRVAVVDTGMEICHPDLAANVEADESYNFNGAIWFKSLATDPFFPSTYGDHGTSVAGIIGGIADNGIGIRGVAPAASLRAYNFLATDDPRAEFDAHGASEVKPNSASVDIFNMSFGGLGGEYVTGSASRALFRNGVENLRDGKGAVYVKAGGNGFGRCDSMRRIGEVEVGESDEDDDGTSEPTLQPYNINEQIGCVTTNSDAWHNLPYILSIGAFGADGVKSNYSSAGPALWVTAPAGDSGIDHPGQITTDQMGTEQGYDAFHSGLIRVVGIPKSENPLGDYINSFNGTSAAAPNASGAIALLFEVQPELTWRDVKYILARSARQIDADIPEVKIGFGGEAAVLRHAWVVNAAGYPFHDWYGFGAINVDEAVALARTHTPDSLGTFSDGEEMFSRETSAEIPDHHGGGVRQTINVSGIASGLNVEGVVLNIEVTHPFTNDLGIYLVSPAGTTSLLNPPFNEILTANEDLDWELLSNAFYGESPLGEWTLKVIDAAPGDVGTLESWSLTFYLGEIPEKT